MQQERNSKGKASAYSQLSLVSQNLLKDSLLQWRLPARKVTCRETSGEPGTELKTVGKEQSEQQTEQGGEQPRGGEQPQGGRKRHRNSHYNLNNGKS